MSKFLLDAHPKFGEVKVTIDHTTYELRHVNGNGAYLSVSDHGVERDQLSLTTQDMKALYLLLTVKDKKK